MTRILRQREAFAYRFAADEQGATLYRGLHLPSYMISADLRARFDQAIDGNPDPELSTDLLAHLAQEHRRTSPQTEHDLGQSWTVDPNVAHQFSKGPVNSYRSWIPYGVILKAQWDGSSQGGDDYLRDNGYGAGLPSEQERVLLPGTPVTLTGLVLHRHNARNRGSVEIPLPLPVARTARRVTA